MFYYFDDNNATATPVPLKWVFHNTAFPLDIDPVTFAITDPPHVEILTVRGNFLKWLM